jgi:hypothetical protein
MNGIVAFLLKQVVDMILGNDVIERVAATVQRWDDKEISGLEKKQEVLSELEIIGIKLSGAAANFAVEAAIQYLRAKEKA